MTRSVQRPVCVSGPEARAIVGRFPSFRDFVDDALFHPAWGYYSTGKVRFGDGGHYDTFPLSLAPLFGRMVAQYAYRYWRRAGEPRQFEICELGAGNGQLCLDTVAWVSERARRGEAWKRFAKALRYRIIERSPALIARQRQHLGALAGTVRWTRADLSQRAARKTPLAPCGLVVANEVLDCLAHHQVVPRDDGTPGVVFVVPVLPKGGRSRRGQSGMIPGVQPGERAVPRVQLPAIFADARRQRLAFREVALPVQVVPALHTFLLRHYPEFFRGKRFRPYFACPEIAPLLRHAAQLYARSEQLWIDYGDTFQFHLGTPASQRVFAGPPRSGATVYRAPGLDDITFLVDFSVVAAAAEGAGFKVGFYGGQRELARRSRVKLDRRSTELIVQYRALSWMLAVVGVGAEREWRHTGLTWRRRGGVRIRDDARHAVDEFLGRRKSPFRLLILRCGS